MIHEVPARLLPALWPAIEGFAHAACKRHPFLEAQDVLAMGLAGKAQFFIAEDRGLQGFAVMEVLEYPRSSVANVLAAGGRRGFLNILVEDLYPLMQEWAQRQGAEMFSLSGRPGWLKVTRPLGFSGVSYSIAYRRLDHERRR